MQEIRVDPCGIKIMMPKAINHLLRINSISNISANILKQEMLSLGGDAAVARDALTGKAKKTDCLLIGNLAQFNRLKEKLKRQPFGLGELSGQLGQALSNYESNNFILRVGSHKLNLSRRAHIMGVVNLTPDSFSGDGLLLTNDRIIDYAQRLVEDGADIIDVGGESSRPGAKPVSVKEELTRTIPVIRALAKKIKVPISIDTHKPQVAEAALDAGAVIVNDITGLTNVNLAGLIARRKAGVVIMHMKGKPQTMQRNPVYKCLMVEIIKYLKSSVKRSIDSGIDENKIIIDPGIGFGKTAEHNLEILKNLNELKVLGRPVLVGPSRKSFIGKILSAGPAERVFGTVSACILAVQNGAKIVRVHDVLETKQALCVSEAINNA